MLIDEHGRVAPEDMGPDGDIQLIDQADADNLAMQGYWKMTDAIVDGVQAMKAAKEEYLPKFPREDQKDYDFRLKSSCMTNVYRDTVESLSSKPFTQQVELVNPDERIGKIQENIDGRGNHLHVFLAETFYRGINSAIHWILIDYPNINLDPSRPLSQADETELGIRPYFVQVRAIDVLHVETMNINGTEEFSYIKIMERLNSGDQVRVFDRRSGQCVFRVYKKGTDGKWFLFNAGVVTIGVIPMVPFFTGRRKGNNWQFYPPMRDAADMQVESYQAETALKYARTLSCHSMLAANGIEPERNRADNSIKPIPQGIGVVLYAPPNGDGSFGNWQRIAADAASLKFLADNIKERFDQMRELGRQPLTAQSGNVTRISAAFAAHKGNSAVQAWAYGLKDAAELAIKIMQKWLGSSVETEVFVYTDFKVESDDNTVPTTLLAMRAARDLSQITYWNEMKGQRVLSADFDPDEETKRIAEETPEPSEEDIAAAMGLPPPVKKPGAPTVPPVPVKKPA